MVCNSLDLKEEMMAVYDVMCETVCNEGFHFSQTVINIFDPITNISSPTDDPFGLPLITRARCHVSKTTLETEALVLSAHEFGTVCRTAYGHLTSATNILKQY